ncbi:MAG: HypC/HybG/HupF family hydrogenase formation chaperone [Candidatus Latescibacteria bacterium]|jgi:hydrogenase expression/formation protein HypC|nr:HypC/HybG/HupF family hydrogenase formation chaperone [Candidatus Latescibacterota bacterium]
MCLAIPGRVTEIYENDGLKMGKVDFGGISREVCLEYLDAIEEDNYVIVHVGFAINVLDEEEALYTLDLLRELVEIEEELEPEQ